METITTLNLDAWDRSPGQSQSEAAIRALESGQVIWLPRLHFRLEAHEQGLLQPGRVQSAGAKNINLSPDGTALRGVEGHAAELELLRRMMWRYACTTRLLLGRLVPEYAVALQHGRTSFRPLEIQGRKTSWRKDDTRLHLDSFPSSPTGGRRILRVFSNINPQQESRVWRLGEPFDSIASRYLHRLAAPVPGSAALLRLLRVTKQRRTPYDHYMLGLHDSMKADIDYQTFAPQQVHAFPAESSWLVFTDQVPHAAMSGQYALEQTFLLPVQAMRDAQRSPLRELERRLGRALV